jgi:hypothetical protein
MQLKNLLFFSWKKISDRLQKIEKETKSEPNVSAIQIFNHRASINIYLLSTTLMP